jgi:hypothetical protein
MNLFAVRFQFLCCCTDGVGRATLAGTSRDIYLPIYLPRAVVEFSFRDVYTLLPTLCHCILLFESPKIYYNIEIYYSVRKESDEINLFRKGPCKTCAHGVLICSDFARLSCAHGDA